MQTTDNKPQLERSLLSCVRNSPDRRAHPQHSASPASSPIQLRPARTRLDPPSLASALAGRGPDLDKVRTKHARACTAERRPTGVSKVRQRSGRTWTGPASCGWLSARACERRSRAVVRAAVVEPLSAACSLSSRAVAALIHVKLQVPIRDALDTGYLGSAGRWRGWPYWNGAALPTTPRGPS